MGQGTVRYARSHELHNALAGDISFALGFIQFVIELQSEYAAVVLFDVPCAEVEGALGFGLRA